MGCEPTKIEGNDMRRRGSIARTFAGLCPTALLALIFFAGTAWAQGQPVIVTGLDDKKVGLVDLDSNLNPQAGAEHRREVEIEVAKKMLNRIPEKGDVLTASPPTGKIEELL